jgi:hypothetical protein
MFYLQLVATEAHDSRMLKRSDILDIVKGNINI